MDSSKIFPTSPSDVDVFIRIEPEPPKVTYQQKKFGGVAKDGKTPIFYEPPRLASARALLRSLLQKVVPQQPLTGAVKMDVTWVFLGKKPSYYLKTPDCDNLQKLLQDVMTGLAFWNDDKQVMPTITKIQLPKDAQHGIYIKLTQLKEIES